MATKRSIAIREAEALERIAKALGVTVEELAPNVKDADIARVTMMEAIAEMMEAQAKPAPTPKPTRSKAKAKAE